MKYIITTKVEDSNGECTGCAFEDIDNDCGDFCPGRSKIVTISKVAPVEHVCKEVNAVAHGWACKECGKYIQND